MTTTTQRKVWFVAALIALAMAASTVNAEASSAFVSYSLVPDTRLATPLVSRPLKVRRHVDWYRSYPATSRPR